MSRISRKSRNRTENKRYGHKQARQATRHVLEDGGTPTVARGLHWSPSIEQPPIHDEAVTGPATKRKGGCKRNKYGPHVVAALPSSVTHEYVFNPDTRKLEFRAIPWTRRRYRPPYQCQKCGKGFYRIPKNAIRAGITTKASPEVEMDDHYDDFNIKMRLLGLKCKCKCCKECGP